VRAFAEQNADRVALFAWLQWLADAQLGLAQARCLGSGMRVGLYRDLAVGVDPAGSRTWSDPHVAVRLATIGAPPDELGPKGQNWGIAPLAPRALAEAGFRPWLEDMRANMRHAGAVRVDHVMGLKRQFWIPQGAGPEDGAYVRYPFEAATAMLALESRRAGCLVVGEDLGTVPPGFRPRLRRAGILSTKVLYYERDYERRRRRAARPPTSRGRLPPRGRGLGRHPRPAAAQGLARRVGGRLARADRRVHGGGGGRGAGAPGAGRRQAAGPPARRRRRLLASGEDDPAAWPSPPTAGSPARPRPWSWPSWRTWSSPTSR
jgi:hypothetical protein